MCTYIIANVSWRRNCDLSASITTLEKLLIKHSKERIGRQTNYLITNFF
jgi:hypothetical protein